jgi:hypothetical protein
MLPVDRNEAQIARWLSGPDHEFPEPWFDAQCFNQCEFWPIRTHAELRDETINMKHCVAAHACMIAAGTVCAVGARQGGARVATALLEIRHLVRWGLSPVLATIRGYKGATVPEIEQVTRDWLAFLAESCGR